MAKLLNVRVTSKHSVRHRFIVQCSILDNTRKFEKLLFRNTNITTNSFVSVASPMRLVDIVRENRSVLKFNNKQNIDKGLEQYVITAQQFSDVTEASKFQKIFGSGGVVLVCQIFITIHHLFHHHIFITSFHHHSSLLFSSPFITNSSW